MLLSPLWSLVSATDWLPGRCDCSDESVTAPAVAEVVHHGLSVGASKLSTKLVVGVVGGRSSLRIVPVTWVTSGSPFTGLVSTRKNVSSGSTTVSPWRKIVPVRVVWPAGN